MLLSPERHYVALAQYLRTGNGSRLSLSAGEACKRPSTSHADCNFQLEPLETFRATIGHSAGGASHWEGYIKDLIIADGKVSPKTFRRIASSHDLSPNPADHDRLQEMLENLRLLTF
jgi:hypothetical protein